MSIERRYALIGHTHSGLSGGGGWPITDQETAIGLTVVDDRYQVGCVLRYKENTDPGTTDMAQAFRDAWAITRYTGGQVCVPPGDYLIGSQVQLNQYTYTSDPIIMHTTGIRGYGASIFAGPAVTGSVFYVYNGSAPHQCVIEGLNFNFRGNTTVGGAIELRRTAHVYLRDISVASHNTKAGCYAILIGPEVYGNDDSNCFWTHIENLVTRSYSGGDGTWLDYGVRMLGTANATTIRNCSFSATETCISAEVTRSGTAVAATTMTAGTTYTIASVGTTNYTLYGASANTVGTVFVATGPGTGTGTVYPTNFSVANALLIEGNHFEAVTRGIQIIAMPAPGYWSTGTRIVNNRAEACDIFCEFDIYDGGTSAYDHSTPAVLMGNYLVGGSVTYYLVNPHNAQVTTTETSYYGPVFGQTEWINGDKNLRIQDTAGGDTYANLKVTAMDGATSTYRYGHIVIGGTHLWPGSDGLLRHKSGAPTSIDDGSAMGGGGTAANPTATVGLAATNGTATTYMRSDAAPALSETISPAWTGNHRFTTNINMDYTKAIANQPETYSATVAGATVYDFGVTFGNQHTGWGGSGLTLSGYYGLAFVTARAMRMEITSAGVIKFSGNTEYSGGAYNTAHPVLGNYHLWAGSDGVPRWKNGSPSSGTDGFPVTLQSTGSFTLTATGMTTSPTGTASWTKVGNIVALYIPSISGTSNATTFTLTGVPSDIIPAATRSCQQRIDIGGVREIGIAQMLTDGTINIARLQGDTFPTSGTKQTIAQQIVYML